MPVHPLWQIKQIVTVDGKRHVDRCLVIGGRTSGRIWCTFMALVLWIAINVRGIKDLLHYSDDIWSYDPSRTLMRYEPYDDLYPPRQVALLKLWDDIGLPHSKRKQVFGKTLTIIGLDVDPQKMSITMPEESKKDLIKSICSFIDTQTSHR